MPTILGANGKPLPPSQQRLPQYQQAMYGSMLFNPSASGHYGAGHFFASGNFLMGVSQQTRNVSQRGQYVVPLLTGTSHSQNTSAFTPMPSVAVRRDHQSGQTGGSGNGSAWHTKWGH